MRPYNQRKLTSDDAVRIFKIKLKQQKPSAVASVFNVSEKAIRDIWSARTWAKATEHLDPQRCTSVRNKPGRPLGSKDTKKRVIRQKRLTIDQELYKGMRGCSFEDPFAKDWKRALAVLTPLMQEEEDIFLRVFVGSY